MIISGIWGQTPGSALILFTVLRSIHIRYTIMASGDVYQLTIQSAMGGQISESVLHFEITTPGEETWPGTIAKLLIQAFQAEVQALYLACLGSDTVLRGYIARRISPSGGNSTFIATPDVTGSGPTPSTASSLGAVLLAGYRSAVSGKYRSGRLFLPGAPQTYISENEPSSAYLDAIIALTEELQANISGSGFVWKTVIWSREDSQAYVGVSGYLNWYYSGKLGTQRRRLKPAL
jgi:hypothetical protein